MKSLSIFVLVFFCCLSLSVISPPQTSVASQSSLLDDLPQPLVYLNNQTNTTLVYNYTSLTVRNNRAYFSVSANTTHSPFLPLQFSFQTINKTFILPYYHYSLLNCTFISQLRSSTYYIDQLTGFTIATFEHRLVSIPELNISRQQLTLYFGPIDPAVLLSNQAFNSQFIQSLQTTLPTIFNESYQAFFSITSNTSAQLHQTISSQFSNASLSALFDLQSHTVTHFNESIDNTFYSYSLLNSSTNQTNNSFITASFIRSFLSQSSLPGFGLYALMSIPLVAIYYKQKRS